MHNRLKVVIRYLIVTKQQSISKLVSISLISHQPLLIPLLIYRAIYGKVCFSSFAVSGVGSFPGIGGILQIDQKLN